MMDVTFVYGIYDRHQARISQTDTGSRYLVIKEDFPRDSDLDRIGAILQNSFNTTEEWTAWEDLETDGQFGDHIYLKVVPDRDLVNAQAGTKLFFIPSGKKHVWKVGVADAEKPADGAVEGKLTVAENTGAPGSPSVIITIDSINFHGSFVDIDWTVEYHVHIQNGLPG